MPLVSCPWEQAGEGWSANDATRIDRYTDVLLAAAEAYELPFAFLAGVAWVESRFAPSATSGKGARGLMQIMPSTWAGLLPYVDVPDDPYDPAASAMVGAFLLRRLVQRWGNETEALAAYFAGSGNVKRHGWAKYAHYVDAVKRARDRFARSLAWCQGISKPGPSVEPLPDYEPPRPRPQPKPKTEPPTSGGGGALVLLALLLWGAASE